MAGLIVVLLGILGYAGAGIASSDQRVADAQHTLDAVISHETSLNATFTDINAQLGALNGSSFKAQDAVGVVDRSVASSQLAMTTINADDSSLSTALGHLNTNRWLTMPGRGNVDREAARLTHARAALAAARTVAADKVQEGKFWHSLYTGLGDLAVLNTQSSAGDLVAAKSTLGTMKTDIDQAAAQSTAPSLPAEMASLMKDLQAFVADYGKQLEAQIAGDDAGVATYQASVQGDLTRIGQYDMGAMGKKIDAFYQPLIDRFNAEMAAATA